MNQNNYNQNVRSLIQMFTDGSAGETVSDNRLITTESDSGNILLVGYGEKVIAEYDESESHVTAYLGHKRGAGKTVSKWLNMVTDEASGRRSLTFSDESPWFAPPNGDAAQYIGSYTDFEQPSAVDRAATKTVVESLKWLNRFL